MVRERHRGRGLRAARRAAPRACCRHELARACRRSSTCCGCRTCGSRRRCCATQRDFDEVDRVPAAQRPDPIRRPIRAARSSTSRRRKRRALDFYRNGILHFLARAELPRAPPARRRSCEERCASELALLARSLLPRVLHAAPRGAGARTSTPSSITSSARRGRAPRRPRCAPPRRASRYSALPRGADARASSRPTAVAFCTLGALDAEPAPRRALDAAASEHVRARAAARRSRGARGCESASPSRTRSTCWCGAAFSTRGDPSGRDARPCTRAGRPSTSSRRCASVWREPLSARVGSAPPWHPPGPLAVDFAKGGGLVTAIAQDHATGEILMVAHMNEESLRETLATRRGGLLEPQRAALAQGRAERKHADAEEPAHRLRRRRGAAAGRAAGGAACHTGKRSCFFRAEDGAPGSTTASRSSIPKEVYGSDARARQTRLRLGPAEGQPPGHDREAVRARRLQAAHSGALLLSATSTTRRSSAS